jgi:hypothetical protein
MPDMQYRWSMVYHKRQDYMRVDNSQRGEAVVTVGKYSALSRWY